MNAPLHSWLQPANEVCEGYVFTGVCLSTGGSASLHAWIRPLGRHTPKQWHAYCQQAGGTHPTGMQSCSTFFWLLAICGQIFGLGNTESSANENFKNCRLQGVNVTNHTCFCLTDVFKTAITIESVYYLFFIHLYTVTPVIKNMADDRNICTSIREHHPPCVSPTNPNIRTPSGKIDLWLFRATPFERPPKEEMYILLHLSVCVPIPSKIIKLVSLLIDID